MSAPLYISFTRSSGLSLSYSEPERSTHLTLRAFIAYLSRASLSAMHCHVNMRAAIFCKALLMPDFLEARYNVDSSYEQELSLLYGATCLFMTKQRLTVGSKEQ